MREKAIAAARMTTGTRRRGEAHASTVAQANAVDAWPDGNAPECGTLTSGFGSGYTSGGRSRPIHCRSP
jgi:hypothetical protein